MYIGYRYYPSYVHLCALILIFSRRLLTALATYCSLQPSAHYVSLTHYLPLATHRSLRTAHYYRSAPATPPATTPLTTHPASPLLLPLATSPTLHPLQDAALLRASVLDSAGHVVHLSSANITFTVVSGPGIVQGEPCATAIPTCAANIRT